MRLPRFRLRTLMIAVAVAAVLIAMGVRRSRFITLARHHQAQAGITDYSLEDDGGINFTYGPVKGTQISSARFKWHLRLCMEYSRAAGHPWLSVPPDPPPPD